MRFQAPGKPGMYNFTIYVRSDSYIELGRYSSPTFWLAHQRKASIWLVRTWKPYKDVRHQFSIQVHEKPPEIDIEEYMDDDEEDPEDDGFITGKNHKIISKI